jgi:hypothetical protein
MTRPSKNRPAGFYTLYDKITRENTLSYAWILVRANQGGPGIDGGSFFILFLLCFC